MSIRKRLIAAVLIPAVLTITAISADRLSAPHMQSSRQLLEQSTLLADSVARLIALNQEHAVHFERRAADQWQLAWQQLGTQLTAAAPVFSANGNRAAHDSLTRGHRAAGLVFSQYRSQTGNPRLAARYASRVIQELQLLDTDLRAIRQQAGSTLATHAQRMQLFLFISLGCAILGVLLIACTIDRRIRRFQKAMLDGFTSHTRTDFSHRLSVSGQGEFDILATAFNRMMEQRQKGREQETERQQTPVSQATAPPPPASAGDTSMLELQRSCDELRTSNNDLLQALQEQKRLNSELNLACEVLKRSHEKQSSPNPEPKLQRSEPLPPAVTALPLQIDTYEQPVEPDNLRASLATVAGFINLAMESEASARQVEYITTAHRAACHLLALLDDTTTGLGKTAQTRLEPQNFSLGELLERVIWRSAEEAAHRGISLLPELAENLPDLLSGDPLRLEQCLTCLLTEAIRQTEQTPISFKVSAAPDPAAQQRILLSATATVPEQTDDRADDLLAAPARLCSQLTTILDGSFKVSHDIDSGRILCLTIPFSFGPRTPRPIRRPSWRLPEQTRLLIISAHADEQHLLHELLVKAGAEVEGFSEVSQALERLARPTPPLQAVLLDIEPTTPDNLACIAAIRRNRSADQLPIIGLCDGIFSAHCATALQNGLRDYLPRPIMRNALYAVLDRLLHMANGEQTAALLHPAIPAELPAVLPGIDQETALERLNGNHELLARLVALFIQEHRNTVYQVEELVRTGDLTTALRHIRTLRSVAGNLAAERLKQSALAIESALQAQDSELVHALLADCSAALHEVCSIMDAKT